MAERNDSATPSVGTRSATYDKSFLSTPVQAQRKRIIICCDGTWQSATSLSKEHSCPSNVARLSRVLARAGLDAKNREWQQLVYYHAGVGTGDITTIEKKRQGGMGLGLLENVIEAYNFLVNNYDKGDEVFLFGFSRGAYTVRSVAGLVCSLGIIRSSSMRRFLRLYSDYINGKDFATPFVRSKAWLAYLEKNEDCYIDDDVRVRVIGVWDTVGALGVPDLGHFWRVDNSSKRKAFEFHDVELNNRIEHAYQALALDEQRSVFSPSVWKLKPGASTKLCQVWFPGAHTNVGGGSESNADEANPTGDREQLSSVSYVWMLDRIRPWLALDERMLKAQQDDILNTSIADTSNVSQGFFWSGVVAVSNAISRALGASGATSAADSFKALSNRMGVVQDSHGLLYDVQGFPEPRTPDQYHIRAQDRAGKMPEGGWPYTVERIHPSVHFRQCFTQEEGLPLYVPVAMRGWERYYEENGMGKDRKPRKGWKWVKYATAKNGKRVKDESGRDKVEHSLWEFEIGHMPQEQSLEKWLIDQSWSKKVLAEVEKGWQDS